MNEKGYRGLKVYRMAFQAAMDIYQVSKSFPKEEKYSLTDQVRRSGRSVCSNIAEGYRKRTYKKLFVLKMADSDGECSETQVWLDFAIECGFLTTEKYEELHIQYEEIGRLLGYMIQNPEKFQ
ncbi:MAG: four helix bundle protein [Bacteroidia bacterium]|nr:four helix bundle protein [Bacteroidia bacterium]